MIVDLNLIKCQTNAKERNNLKKTSYQSFIRSIKWTDLLLKIASISSDSIQLLNRNNNSHHYCLLILALTSKMAAVQLLRNLFTRAARRWLNQVEEMRRKILWNKLKKEEKVKKGNQMEKVHSVVSNWMKKIWGRARKTSGGINLNKWQ